MSSLFSSVRNRRSLSPMIRRLLELSVDYQRQEQNSQNHPTSPHANPIELNKQAEKRIRTLVKLVTKSKRNGSIEELEKAILHKDARTRCVTVPR